jgi:hypothetical protein
MLECIVVMSQEKKAMLENRMEMLESILGC